MIRRTNLDVNSPAYDCGNPDCEACTDAARDRESGIETPSPAQLRAEAEASAEAEVTAVLDFLRTNHCDTALPARAELSEFVSRSEDNYKAFVDLVALFGLLADEGFTAHVAASMEQQQTAAMQRALARIMGLL